MLGKLKTWRSNKTELKVVKLISVLLAWTLSPLRQIKLELLSFNTPNLDAGYQILNTFIIKDV